MSSRAELESERARRPIKWRIGSAVAGLAVIGACVLVRYYWGTSSAAADTPQAAPESIAPPPPATPAATQPATPQSRSSAAAAPSQTGAKIVATVNNEPITREELAQECLRHYGKEVLESLVNKYLIAQECKRHNIAISQADVDEEIRRVSSRFSLPIDQWLKMLKQERGINPIQYAQDIIWPTLALRRLAGGQLQVAEKEIAEEYEKSYGEAVSTRIIVSNDRATAEKVRAEALARPDEFGNLAKDKSVDVHTASGKGLIPPIHHHTGDPKIEQVLFAMRDGEISEVMQVGNQFVVAKRERLLPASRVRYEQVRERLEWVVRDRKLRQVSHDVFRELQKTAQVRNVYNDATLSQQMPGVAATINGQSIPVRELAELCMERHGEEVLEGTINRRLLEQACKKQNIAIADADVDQEIARAAKLSVKPRPDGSPDVDAWLKLVTQQQNVPLEIYRRDAVWPSVALRKLAGGSVTITDEDLQKGFEANFGPRVRCRAIVLNNLRRAQQVWEMARSKPTPEYFGDLAEQYSVEASSRSLRGEVAPIQQHGGQPLLERAAFNLRPGELSEIVDVGSNRFVILLCEGRTEPVKVDFRAVRDDIQEDIKEKKTRVAMSQCFDKLQSDATIDNYLAGTSRSPARNKGDTGQASPQASRASGEMRTR